MEKKTIFKVIIAIILIVVVLFLANTFRKFFILQEMQNNANMYISSVNFHKKVVIKEDNNETGIIDSYQKDGKTVVIINNDKENTKTSLYYDEKQCDEFYETTEGKKAKLNSNATLMGSLISNYVQTENSWLRFWASIYTNTKEVEINGKQCYLITGNLNSAFPLTSSNEKEIYIEKDTGLCIKIVYDNGKTDEIEYEFNNVSDEIFIKPDVNQYKVIEE